MNIPELRLQIKNFAEDAVGEWGLIAIVLLVGIASFGLGRLSAFENVREPVSITQAAAAITPQGISLGKLIVASRSGKTYYFPWCTGVARISPQNQVWFPSEDAARAAGYAPAKGCKGLR